MLGLKCFGFGAFRARGFGFQGLDSEDVQFFFGVGRKICVRASTLGLKP